MDTLSNPIRKQVERSEQGLRAAIRHARIADQDAYLNQVHESLRKIQEESLTSVNQRVFEAISQNVAQILQQTAQCTTFLQEAHAKLQDPSNHELLAELDATISQRVRELQSHNLDLIKTLVDYLEFTRRVAKSTEKNAPGG